MTQKRALSERIGREPVQRPGKSKQDYETPADLLAAVAARFGPLRWDLASSGPSNAKAPLWFTAEDDSLAQDWFALDGHLWLNPPFANIEPWAQKCAVTATSREFPSCLILLLTPASVGSVWFSKYVHGRAKVLALNPRLTFVGAADPYPKDCMLSVFGEEPGFDVWRWKP